MFKSCETKGNLETDLGGGKHLSCLFREEPGLDSYMQEEFLICCLVVLRIQDKHLLQSITQLCKKNTFRKLFGTASIASGENNLAVNKKKSEKHAYYYHTIQEGARIPAPSGASSSCRTHCGERLSIKILQNACPQGTLI